MTKKTIFVSHSSLDKDLVSAFLDAVFPTACLNTTDYDIRYTSAAADQIEQRLKAGENIWETLQKDIYTTEIFIACISNNYFSSIWCISELAVFYDKQHRSKKSPINIIPLRLTKDCDKWKETPFLQKPVLIDAWSRNDILNYAIRITKEKMLSINPFESDPDAFQKYIDKFNHLTKTRHTTAKGELTDLAINYHYNALTENGPWICMVPRAEYEQISVNMAKKANNKLLWTLFKSPLLVAEAYIKPNYLMEYDSEFSNFDPTTKMRLVIFESAIDAKAYKELDFAYHSTRLAGLTSAPIKKRILSQRRNSFEKAALKGGCLYFTSLEKLNIIMNSRGWPDLTYNSYLEFAYTESLAPHPMKMIMDSSFNSEWAKRNSRPNKKMNSAWGHVTFFNPSLNDACKSEINSHPYKPFFEHFQALNAIVEELLEGSPKERFFVDKYNIEKLY